MWNRVRHREAIARVGLTPMAGTLGSRSRARKGQVLSPAFLERRWKPGQSGNPSGQTAEYGDVVRLAQSLSLRAIERLSELMDSEDERVAAVACNAILDRAFGKPQPNRPEQDSFAERLARMTPEERIKDAQELYERVQRVLRNHRASEPPVVEGETQQVPEQKKGRRPRKIEM